MGLWRVALVGLVILGIGLGGVRAGGKGNPTVLLSTSMGDIKLELYSDKAPITAQNFLDYVKAGYYNGTIFHRVIPGFMIQGGGFEPGLRQKPTKGQIKNESANGLANKRGTLAMARTNSPRCSLRRRSMTPHALQNRSMASCGRMASNTWRTSSPVISSPP